MIRLPQWSICAVLLTGCASLPEPPAVEPEVPSGAPWGLAWIPPSGEVAIKAGAVEHVLYPDATTQKPALAPVIPRTDVDPAFRGSVVPSPSRWSSGAGDTRKISRPASSMRRGEGTCAGVVLLRARADSQ